MQAVAAERVCRAFDDVASRADLRALGDATADRPGALPPIVAMGGYAGAEWVEFDPDWSPAGVSRRECPGRESPARCAQSHEADPYGWCTSGVETGHKVRGLTSGPEYPQQVCYRRMMLLLPGSRFMPETKTLHPVCGGL